MDNYEKYREFLIKRGSGRNKSPYSVATLNRYTDDIRILESKFGSLLQDPIVLIEKINANYQESTTKAKMTSISLYMEHMGDKDKQRIFLDRIKDLSIKQTKERMNQKKNEKQKKSWIKYSKLMTILKDRLKKIKKILKYPIMSINNKKYIQRTLILGLYTLTPPRRNEYGNVMLISATDYENIQDRKKNYLVLSEKPFFHFGCFKTFKKFGEQQIPIPKKLMKLIKAIHSILTKNKQKYLLIKLNRKNNGDTLGRNSVSQQLTKLGIEEETGKLGVELLRHIYISDARKDDMKLKDKINLSKSMAHSMREQELYRLF